MMTMSSYTKPSPEAAPFLVVARTVRGPFGEVARAIRIEQLRAQIAAGTYRVSSAEIAESLLKRMVGAELGR